MEELVKKIVERLDEYKYNDLIERDDTELCNHCKSVDCDSLMNCSVCIMDKAISIVQEVAEGCNNGWIPISESVPDSDRFILLSFENFPIPIVGRYVGDDEGGTFYAGSDLPLVSQNLFVNAWMELPEPYKGGGRHLVKQKSRNMIKK